MKDSKWFSRKLWITIIGVITGILIALGKITPETAESTTTTILGVIATIASVLGYQFAQGSVDKAKVKKDSE